MYINSGDPLRISNGLQNAWKIIFKCAAREFSLARWQRGGERERNEQKKEGRKREEGVVGAGCHRQWLKHVLLARSHVVKNLVGHVAKASDEIKEGQGRKRRLKGRGEGGSAGCSKLLA